MIKHTNLYEEHHQRPLVSVLVACYNVGQFIDNAIPELLSQTYANFELIMVDDCSTDDTYIRLKEWGTKDIRISVFHHSENLGLGCARNTGLNHAKGKYIYFADIDDHVDPRLLSFCVDKMETTIVDMMMFGYEVVDMYNNTSDFVIPKERLFNNNLDIRNIYVQEILLSKYGSGFVWSKFYRRSFLKETGIRFGTLKIQQDEVFNLKVLGEIQKLYISPEVLYRYYIYKDGNNGSRFIPDRFEIILAVREAFEVLMSKWNITDGTAFDYLDKRLYSGLLKHLDYDLNHRDCKMKSDEKRTRFLETTGNPKSHAAAIHCLRQSRNVFDKVICHSIVSRKYDLYRVTVFFKKCLKTLYTKCLSRGLLF